jgi:hypothetical protein
MFHPDKHGKLIKDAHLHSIRRLDQLSFLVPVVPDVDPTTTMRMWILDSQSLALLSKAYHQQ